MSDSLQSHGLYSLWNSPGQNTAVGSLSLLQGIFPTQQSNPGLPHCRILYQLSHQGSPRILEWVAYPFSRGSSWPRNQTGVSCIAGRFFTNWAIKEARSCYIKIHYILQSQQIHLYSDLEGGIQFGILRFLGVVCWNVGMGVKRTGPGQPCSLTAPVSTPQSGGLHVHCIHTHPAHPRCPQGPQMTATCSPLRPWGAHICGCCSCSGQWTWGRGPLGSWSELRAVGAGNSRVPVASVHTDLLPCWLSHPSLAQLTSSFQRMLSIGLHTHSLSPTNKKETKLSCSGILSQPLPCLAPPSQLMEWEGWPILSVPFSPPSPSPVNSSHRLALIYFFLLEYTWFTMLC